MQPKPDPKLQLAMEEIKAVLVKHDLIGAVTLANAKAGEFFIKLNANWGCFDYDPTTGSLSINNTRFPDNASRHEALTASVHAIQTVAQCAIDNVMNCDNILEVIGKHFEITGGPRKIEIDGKS